MRGDLPLLIVLRPLAPIDHALLISSNHVRATAFLKAFRYVEFQVVAAYGW
jgi:hypothetical protein